MRRRVYVTVECPSVCPSACLVDRQLPLAVTWAGAADIDQQLLASRTGYRSARAPAAAGSVMLRAEVRG